MQSAVPDVRCQSVIKQVGKTALDRAVSKYDRYPRNGMTSIASANKASRLCPPDGNRATERDKALTALTRG